MNEISCSMTFILPSDTIGQTENGDLSPQKSGCLKGYRHDKAYLNFLIGDCFSCAVARCPE